MPRFFLTTAIDYVNNRPHLGTAYEKIAAIAAREKPIIYLYHRNWLWAHTSKLSGLRTVPDGMVRVQGLKFN